MRTPFQEQREPDLSSVRTRIAEGLRYLWNRPFLRACAVIYGLGNPLMPAVLLVLVVVGREQGLSGGEIGVLTAVLGAAALTGSLASPLLRRTLPIRAIMLLELWTWLGCWVFVAWPSVYALLAVIVPFGIAAPNTKTCDGSSLPSLLSGRRPVMMSCSYSCLFFICGNSVDSEPS